MKTSPGRFYDTSGERRESAGATRGPRSRGMALMVTLILLSLLGAASVAMVLLVSSDTMINGYYRNFRGSFYAADSGVNVVVESMKSAVLNAATDTANPPLPSSVPASVTSAYTPYQNAYFTFGDTNSWNAKFTMVSNPSGAAVIGAPTVTQAPNPSDAASCLPAQVVSGKCPDGTTADTDYIWTVKYPYTVTIKGQSSGTETEEVTESGFIVYASTSGSASAGGPPNFSKWAAFITNFGDCQGPLVPGTMNGPFFTDGQWNFGNFSNPGYTFNGTIGQAGAKASWWSNNNCTDSATAPAGFKKPTFNGGALQLNQTTITPPSDSYAQAQAVLDGMGAQTCQTTPCTPNPSQEHQELKTVGGTKYPATGSVPTGVYIPYYTSGTSPSGQTCTVAKPCYGADPTASWTDGKGNAMHGDGYGGGFYVNGDATVTLSATTFTNPVTNAIEKTQTYTITQGSTTTTIVVNNAEGTTTVSDGTTTVPLQGVPTQLTTQSYPVTGSVMNTTEPGNTNAVYPSLVYVNGTASLQGPYDGNGNSLPAIQDQTGVTVVGSTNVNINGNLEYASSPVSIPADTLNSSTKAGVLGIYTLGNISLYPDPNDYNSNLTVNGSMAALSGQSNGNSGFATPGGSINTWTIVGGRSEDHAHGVSISQGNTYYDQRFGLNFGPPWFPTAVPPASTPSVPSSQSVSVSRASWAEVSR